jgi:hypothetical protein
VTKEAGLLSGSGSKPKLAGIEFRFKDMSLSLGNGPLEDFRLRKQEDGIAPTGKSYT